MTRRASLVSGAAVVLLLACLACTSSSSGGVTPAPVASASASPSASASAHAAVTASPTTWSGTYASAPGSLYVYDGGEWKGVHFRGDDASTGLGEGTLTFTIDPKTHALRGTANGPLGDLVLAGVVAPDAGPGGELTFSVLRKDPADRGLTGTAVATVQDRSVTGTMRLSRGDAHVLRSVKFTLTPAP